mgnify:CR=1 FL=1
MGDGHAVAFVPDSDIVFDCGEPLPEHPNGLVFELLSPDGETLLSETYFSVGGGFVSTLTEMRGQDAVKETTATVRFPYPFDSAASMLQMAADSGLSIADMKRANEHVHRSSESLEQGIDAAWRAMRRCVDNGLRASGLLPGGLALARRAKALHDRLLADPRKATVNDWLCAYAMAVNEENAAGRMVVTAPTNGAAGVVPAVLYYLVTHEGGTPEQVRIFLLTAAAIGGIIKHRSSISGAEVGCQGEVGVACSMAAGGLTAAMGGTMVQVENAAEIGMEHNLGLTCDPVGGLVQIPCIERNAMAAVKAINAQRMAFRGDGKHRVSLDKVIKTMRDTGADMKNRYKETSRGGLAVNVIEC